MALSHLCGQLIYLSGAEYPEMTEVLFTVVARGVAALLGGHVKGTDHGRP